MASRSHFNLGSALARGLANAGHDVTLLSPYDDNYVPTNGTYRPVVLNEILEKFNENDMDMFTSTDSMLKMFKTVKETMDLITRGTLGSNKVKKMLDDGETFDAVIIEEFGIDALKVLRHLFKAHLIVYSSIGSNPPINNLVGNPSPLSFIPTMMSDLPIKMTFFQRFSNLCFHVIFNAFKGMLIPNQSDLLNEYYPGSPSIEELNKNVSLALMNSHVSNFQPIPTVPKMVAIGGYHVQPPKGLPKDLKDYLDSAKHGVIYFSMGSILKSKNMPREKVEIILGAFKQLKQKVLWKWEEDNLPGISDNVRTMKWVPQSDILAHPNVKLFITHGGLLSTTETIYFGKPVLCIPIFGDQPVNAQNMVQQGFALRHDYKYLTNTEEFLAKIKEMLNNPKYYETAQTKSKIMHDRKVKPIDEAVFWVEYVIRHNGAQHLRVAGEDLTWYQYHLIDVVAFLFVIVGLVLTVLFVFLRYIIRKVLGCMCKSRGQNNKIKKN
ncbi:UDP-glycosyltransferase UGT5-like isoform X3 [Aethina tumida]|uniref:UDP-glycosyltransferase UGT5-like isoform X3 n=1 Tax=Aethina tumida TaxID=116153 RepID=UPI0021476B30|nr:UDP-glycosyltransferase UGT5-like isoform X3 [Aethina tumida]